MHLCELCFPPLLFAPVSSCMFLSLSFSRSSISSSELVWSRWVPSQRSGVFTHCLRGLDTLGTSEVGSVRVATSLLENTMFSVPWMPLCACTSGEPTEYFGVIDPKPSLSRAWQKQSTLCWESEDSRQVSSLQSFKKDFKLWFNKTFVKFIYS